MAVTLPTPGGDSNTWGDELNAFLSANFTDDGRMKNPFGHAWRSAGWMDARQVIPVGTTTTAKTLPADQMWAQPMWLGDPVMVDGWQTNIATAAVGAVVSCQIGIYDIPTSTMTITNTFPNADASTTGLKTQSFTAEEIPGGPVWLILGTGTAAVQLTAYDAIYGGLYMVGTGAAGLNRFTALKLDTTFPFSGSYGSFPGASNAGTILYGQLRKA